MKEVLKIAIENGWNPARYLEGVTGKCGACFLIGNRLEVTATYIGRDPDRITGDMNRTVDFWVHITRMIADPLFWQALGKGLGWNDRYNWIHYSHKGFRCLMTGGDIKNFLKELLESKEKKLSTDDCYLEYVEGYLMCTFNHKIGDVCLMNK